MDRTNISSSETQKLVLICSDFLNKADDQKTIFNLIANLITFHIPLSHNSNVFITHIYCIDKLGSWEHLKTLY